MNEIRNKRFLIVNPFGIGDVLFTTPIIEAIKKESADNYIGYICNIRTAPLLSSNPNVNKVFVYEKDEYRNLWKESKTGCIKKFSSFLREVKGEKFDTAFDLSMAKGSGFFLKLAGIGGRIGYNYKNRGIFLTARINLKGGYSEKHMAEYYKDLLPLAGISIPEKHPLNIYIPDENKKNADRLLAENGISGDELFIAMAPGGGASWGGTSFRKHWKKDGFAEVARLICGDKGMKLLLLGSSSDKPICDYIHSREIRTIDLCAKTGLLEFAAIVKRSKLLLTNDGGPLHVGVATGTKTVSIFGPVDDKVYGPYPLSDRHLVIKNKDIDCRPCYRNFKIPKCEGLECLEDIAAETVMDAIKKGLAE